VRPDWTTAELCRQQGITEQTYYSRKAKYGGMESGEANRLKQLEDDDQRLKQLLCRVGNLLNLGKVATGTEG
jgi:hypothetical protein